MVADQIEVSGAVFVSICLKVHDGGLRSGTPIQFAIAETVPLAATRIDVGFGRLRVRSPSARFKPSGGFYLRGRAGEAYGLARCRAQARRP